MEPALRKFIKRTRETGMLIPTTINNRSFTVHTPTNIIVDESVRKDLNISTRHRSSKLDQSYWAKS